MANLSLFGDIFYLRPFLYNNIAYCHETQHDTNLSRFFQMKMVDFIDLFVGASWIMVSDGRLSANFENVEQNAAVPLLSKYEIFVSYKFYFPLFAFNTFLAYVIHHAAKCITPQKSSKRKIYFRFIVAGREKYD